MAVRFPKRTYKRPGYKACYTMVRGDAQKALAVARNVKALLNVERKFLQVITSSVVTNARTADQITNVDQGDTTSSRDGDQIKLVYVSLHGLVTIHPSATTSNVRILVVWDKQTNGILFTQENLLEDVTTGLAGISPFNLDNKYRFNVLYDRLVVVSTDTPTVKFKFSKRLNLKVRYSTNAGTISDLRSGSLSSFFISNEPTNAPTVRRAFRIRYVDN